MCHTQSKAVSATAWTGISGENNWTGRTWPRQDVSPTLGELRLMSLGVGGQHKHLSQSGIMTSHEYAPVSLPMLSKYLDVGTVQKGNKQTSHCAVSRDSTPGLISKRA